jgi:hypothetical protein
MGIMKKHYALTALLLMCGWASAQQKVGWSLGYYCGWDQDAGFKPAQIDWKAFTHIAHFTTFPNPDGTLDVSNGLTDENCKAAVAEAHKNNVKIVFSIGGAGAKDRFKSATSDANVHKFVSNLIQFMMKYGYDGIDTDWEENYSDALFLNWHKILRDSINAHPGKSLTLAGGGYFASHCAIAHPYVDMMNTMSYDVALGGMTNEMKEYTSRGVPKTKLGVGLGIGGGGAMQETDSNKAKGKVLFALNGGFGGVMQWAVQGSARHVAIFKMLEQYIPSGPSVVWADGKLQVVNEPSLMVGRNVITGMQEVRYRVDASPGGAPVDLSLFNLNGSLLRRVVNGRSQSGTFAVPLRERPGTYLVRLSAGSRIESAKATIIP